MQPLAATTIAAAARPSPTPPSCGTPSTGELFVAPRVHELAEILVAQGAARSQFVPQPTYQAHPPTRAHQIVCPVPCGQ
eukprot:gene13139-biopygen17001